MKKIDIKGGQMTYGQRIELGKICNKYAGSEDPNVAHNMLKEVYTCLHGKAPVINPVTIVGLLQYLHEVVEGILFWVEREQTALKYDPSPEELKAGVKDLSLKIGEFGTIKALAKTYSRDPDEVLEWKYGKVFGLLYTDLEEHKFSVKLNKVHENAMQQKYGKRTR